jgi:hypothetical protein
MSKRVIGLLGFGLLALCLTVAIWHSTQPPIEYHKNAIGRLRYPSRPTRLRDYFSSSYVLWTLQGRPSDVKVINRREEHINKLVSLGYLQKRAFHLQHRQLEMTGAAELFESVRRDSRLQEPLSSWSYTFGSNVVTVIARPAQMKVWEELLRQFDSTNTPLRPHAANSGRPTRSTSLSVDTTAIGDAER